MRIHKSVSFYLYVILTCRLSRTFPSIEEMLSLKPLSHFATIQKLLQELNTIRVISEVDMEIQTHFLPKNRNSLPVK